MSAGPAAAPAVSPAVTLRGVGKVWPNGTRALQPLDLTVSRGEVVTLLGPSGCGKSTLLRIVAGLLPANSGEVRVFGEPPQAAPSRRLGFVFQEATLMPWARVDANVRLPLDLAGVPRAEADARVRDALATVGLADAARLRPRELSGGMQMRVSIARALVTGPELLLMDEPFGALDEITRNRLDDELLALVRAKGLALLFVTHSIHEAVFLSHRVAVMAARPGRIVETVEIDEPLPRDAAFRVGTAFAATAQRLNAALRDASVDSALRDASVDERPATGVAL